MLEEEHPEICKADIEELTFSLRCRSLLEELKMQPSKEHPRNTDPLPRAAPKPTATYRLEWDPRTGTYNPVPIIPQYARDDSTGGEPR